jgi:hypothetical protein
MRSKGKTPVAIRCTISVGREWRQVLVLDDGWEQEDTGLVFVFFEEKNSNSQQNGLFITYLRRLATKGHALCRDPVPSRFLNISSAPASKTPPLLEPAQWILKLADNPPPPESYEWLALTQTLNLKAAEVELKAAEVERKAAEVELAKKDLALSEERRRNLLIENLRIKSSLNARGVLERFEFQRNKNTKESRTAFYTRLFTTDKEALASFSHCLRGEEKTEEKQASALADIISKAYGHFSKRIHNPDGVSSVLLHADTPEAYKCIMRAVCRDKSINLPVEEILPE